MSATGQEQNAAAPGAPAHAPEAGGSSSKLPAIISIVNLLVNVGLLAVLYMSFQKEKNRPSVDDISTKAEEKGKEEGGEHGGEHGHGEHGGAKEKEAKKPSNFGKMISLEQFTVNLSTPGSVNPKFVRLNIALGVPNEEIENEVNTKIPQIRNTIIDLVNSKRPADLAAVEGREDLKEQIKSAINGFLVTGKVTGVFFTSFALAS